MLKLLKKIGYWGWWAIAVATTYLLTPSWWDAETLPFSQRAFWAAVAGIGFWAVWTGLDWLKDNRPRTNYGVNLALTHCLLVVGGTHIYQGEFGAGAICCIWGVLYNTLLAFIGPPEPTRPEIDPFAPNTDTPPAPEPEKFLSFLRGLWADRPVHEVNKLVSTLRRVIGVFAAGRATDIGQGVVFVGTGSNGKTVLLNIVEGLFSDDAVVSVSPEAWDNEVDRIALKGAAVNLVDGADTLKWPQHLADVLSGGLVCGRGEDGRPQAFCSKAGHIFVTNYVNSPLPRRLLKIPFTRVFPAGAWGISTSILATERRTILAWAAAAVDDAIAEGTYTPAGTAHPEIDASRGIYVELPRDAPPFLHDGRGRVIPPDQYTLTIVKD